MEGEAYQGATVSCSLLSKACQKPLPEWDGESSRELRGEEKRFLSNSVLCCSLTKHTVQVKQKNNAINTLGWWAAI